MKKLQLFKTMLLLFALIVGSTNAWGDNTYVKVTSADQLVTDGTGIYILAATVSQNTYVATGFSSNTLAVTSSGFSIDGNTITISSATPLEFTLGGSSTGYTLQYTSGVTTYYLGYANSKSKTNLEQATTNTDDKEKWTYSIPTGKSYYTLVNVKTIDRFLASANTGTIAFKAYATSNYDTYPAVNLYKKQVAIAPTAISFKVGETTMTADGTTKNDLGNVTSATLTLTPNQTSNVYYTTDGTEPTTSSTAYSSAISITEPCTIWALASNSAGSVKAKALFKFSRANSLAFGNSEYTAYLSEGTFSTTLTNPNNLPVTYESYDEDVATVASDGTVTLKAAGETIITATFAGNDTYAAGEVDYTLTVSNKVSADLAYTPNFIHIEEPTYNTEISAPIALTNPHSVAVTYSSTDETVATVSSTGAVTPKKLGTTTIKATFAGDATYEADEVSYILKLGLLDAGLAFDADSHEMTYSSGGTFTMDFIKDTDADAEFTSSNTAVATVDAETGEITVLSVGTTTITATTAKTSDYKAGSVSYDLTVNENTTPSGATSDGTTLLEENVSGYTGANDGTQALATNSNYLDYDSWTSLDAVYAGGKDAESAGQSHFKFGSSNYVGKAVAENIALTGSGILTYKVMYFNSSYSGTLNVSVTGATATGDVSVTGTSAWVEKTVNLSDATGSVDITFQTTSSNKRIRVDDIKLVQSGTPTVSATIPASTWGTYCSPYALDFSNAATTVTAYAVSDYDAAAATITFAKITGKVPAKTPIVITGTAGAQKIAVAEGETSAPATNLLRGYLSPAYYAGADASETLMGLSGGTFKKMQAGTIPANKAVLVMDTDDFNDIPDGDSSKMTFIFEEESETDGIKTIHNAQFIMHNDTYNLAGQRVGNDYKGIVIEKGKKVVRK